MATQPQAAVGGGDDVLFPYCLRESLKPLRRQLGRLNERCRVCDDARRQDLSIRKLYVGPDRVLVLVRLIQLPVPTPSTVALLRTLGATEGKEVAKDVK